MLIECEVCPYVKCSTKTTKVEVGNASIIMSPWALTSVEDTEKASGRIKLRSARLGNARVEVGYRHDPVLLALCASRGSHGEGDMDVACSETWT